MLSAEFRGQDNTLAQPCLNRVVSPVVIMKSIIIYCTWQVENIVLSVVFNTLLISDYAQDLEFVCCELSYPNKPHYGVVMSRELTGHPARFVFIKVSHLLLFPRWELRNVLMSMNLNGTNPQEQLLKTDERSLPLRSFSIRFFRAPVSSDAFLSLLHSNFCDMK